MPLQSRHKFCVLLVDDDRDTRAMYAIALAACQFEVLEAGDGETALAAASEHLPDVIVTDLTGPALDGFELLEWLQATPLTANIRTIVLTGWTDTKTPARAAALDALFVLKPCLPGRLVFHVYCALGNVAAWGLVPPSPFYREDISSMETKAEERGRLHTRTEVLQNEHDAMISPPRTDAEKDEHHQHRKSLRKHKADLKANMERAADK
jgi:DNA-binding response OmpR family regulator